MLKIKKFLLCVDQEDSEIYIRHREYPACLIYVEQSIPVNFVVMDLFEEMPDEEAKKHYTDESFKKRLSDFWLSQANSAFNFN